MHHQWSNKGRVLYFSKVIARAVFKQAVADGVAVPVPEELINGKIESNFWTPEYRDYRRTSF